LEKVGSQAPGGRNSTVFEWLSEFVLCRYVNRSTNLSLFFGSDRMIEQLKQWFIPSATVVIHVWSGRKQVFHKKKFTIGYGSINTWNLDSEKPHASLLVFKKTKSSLEVTPANPDDTLLLDGKPWMGEVLAKESVRKMGLPFERCRSYSERTVKQYAA